MKIVFHVHLFPDALAVKTIEKLARIAGDEHGDAPHYTDGTLRGTLEKMDVWGVDRAVTQHIATSVHAMHKVNDFAASVRSERLYAFGSVHPDAPDALEELERIHALGLTALSSIRIIRIFSSMRGAWRRSMRRWRSCICRCCSMRGGIRSPELLHAEPERLARVAEGFPELTIIAAHLGGMRRYDQVEKASARPQNVYLDTAMTAAYLHDEAQFVRVLRGHGLDRVLFATDCPLVQPGTGAAPAG